MMNLSGKKIILGVSGSIAAYKAILLLRMLKKAGADVKVVLTPAVEKFVGELTWGSLTGEKVFVDLWGENWSEHVDLGNWADLMVVAPATANTIAKMATGLCDNALTAVYLAAACPVMVAPAMDADMYRHPSLQDNLALLQKRRVTVLPTNTGFLASGLEGPGRLLEPEEILVSIEQHFALSQHLAGKHILVSAGPTRESIDPVRFITNHSTGKMGYAIAIDAARRGAKVSLVAGPTLFPDPPGLETLHVQSSQDMFECIKELAPQQDAIIMSAAVSDYRPTSTADQKIKKQEGNMGIELERTTDILAYLGTHKPDHQLLVGFALETQNEQANATKKLKKKNLDMIVLNSLRDKGAGFGHDTNKVSVLDKDGSIQEFDLKSKTEVAKDIMDVIEEKLLGVKN